MEEMRDNLPGADGGANNQSSNNQAESNPQEEQKQTETTAEETSAVKQEEVSEASETTAEDADKKEEKTTEGEDELQQGDDTEEVYSDEDDNDEYAHEELELPDYSLYSPEKLVKEAEKLLKNEPVQKIKEHFESIRKNLLKQLNEERDEKLRAFVEEGNAEIDFEYVQPLRESFRKIFQEYRKKRKKYYDELREKLEANLQRKQELIEELKALVEKNETIGDTFKEFNKIQDAWRQTGPVPRAESADLYRTWHHHLDNFYEYIKINKELRDLDFKKNRELKEDLIRQAEKLLERSDIPKAFKELQTLHRKWKNTGPVERENREPMWEKFSALTKQMHEKREEYYQKLREKRSELIEEKKEFIQKIREFPKDFKKHGEWQKAIKEVNALSEGFKKIGRLNHPENDQVWEDFKTALREFNHAKNEFYKGLKKQHQANLEKKKELLAKAEELKDSEDWKNATNEFKRIQAEWKKIGHVPKSESDKIWEQFRNACNHYFERLTAKNEELDKKFEENYTKKEKLLEQLKAAELPDNQKEAVKKLKGIINDWKEIGPVPRAKRKIEKDFNEALDGKFKSIDLDRQESQRIRFENKMQSMVEQGGDQQLNKEKDHLRKREEEVKKELNQLETNLSFFSSSNKNNPLLKEAERKIEATKKELEELRQKIKMLNVKSRQLQEESAESQEENDQD